MIRINVTGDEGSALLQRAKDCPAVLAARVADLTDPTLALEERAAAIPEAAAYLANLVFGEMSGPKAGHRFEAFRELYELNPRIFHVALASQEVNLAVALDGVDVKELPLGGAVGYSTVVPITKVALDEYRSGKGILFDERGVLKQRNILRPNKRGGPAAIYIEGVAFLPFLRFKTPTLYDVVTVEGEPDAPAYFRALFRHIASFVQDELLSRDDPSAWPVFVCGTNPEENVGSALVALLGFELITVNVESIINQPRFCLELGGRAAWQGRTGIPRMVQLLREARAPQGGEGESDGFDRLVKDILRLVKPRRSATRRKRTSSPVVRRRLPLLTADERKVFEQLQGIKNEFDNTKARVAGIYRDQLVKMAGMDFGSFETKRPVLNLINRLADLLGLDFFYEDDSIDRKGSLCRVNVRAAKNGQIQVREAVRNGHYLYSQYAFPKLVCKDREADETPD
jgi:hypothetical protein